MDIDTELSAYDRWGIPTTSRTSWMTLGTLVKLEWVGMITKGLFICLTYISANNRDIDTNLSAYDPCGYPLHQECHG